MRSLIAASLLRAFGALPLPVTHALGATIGWLLSVVPNRRQRTARKNLALCFPEMNERARGKLVRKNLMELGKSVFEVARLWSRDKKGIVRLVRHSHGEEQLKQALQIGRGVILAIPHLGAWEMVGLYCSMHYPFTALYLAASSGDIIRKARERFGAKLVPTDNNGIRALYKALERGEIVGILPDQVPAKN